jgi:AmmeMemoRadiSam system protein A
VEEVARKAAFEDPRFPPVRAEELPEISIEISFLSPLEKVRDISTIEVGKHGLVMEGGGRRGLLLPQVATEYKWNREEFLHHTAKKAGLPPESWRSMNVMLCSFTTDTFSEAEFQPH